MTIHSIASFIVGSDLLNDFVVASILVLCLHVWYMDPVLTFRLVTGRTICILLVSFRLPISLLPRGIFELFILGGTESKLLERSAVGID